MARPGTWSQDAWRLVAPALVELEAWGLTGLVIEAEGVRHCFWPRAPGVRQGFLTLRQDPPENRWSFNHPALNGSAFTPVAGDAADSFFQAILTAEALRHGSPLAQPAALRLAVSAWLIDHRERSERAQGHPAWIVSPGRHSPHLPTPPETGASSHQPVPAPAAAVPSQEPYAATALVETARHLARFGDIEGACLRLELVPRPDQIPLELIRLMSTIAVNSPTGGPQPIQRMGTLIERLSDHPHRLFEASLGISADGRILDLCNWDIRHGYFENKREGADGISAPLARVLFDLHLRRGRISEGMKFIVGHHGSGVLDAMIRQCIKEQGWEPVAPRWRNTGQQVLGILVAAPATGSSMCGYLDHTIIDGKALSGTLRPWLCALDKDSSDEKAERKTWSAIRSAHSVESLREIVDALDQHPGLAVDFYEAAAESCVRVGAWELLDEVLSTVGTRRQGGFGPIFWPALYLLAGHFHDGWGPARTVFQRRLSHPGEPTAQEWRALFSRARTASALTDAIDLYRDQRDSMSEEARIAASKTLLIRGAYMRKWAPCQFFLKELNHLHAAHEVEVGMGELILNSDMQTAGSDARRLNALARRQTPMALGDARDLIEWHVRRSLWDSAADFIRASRDRRDTFYRDALGWEPAGAPPTPCIDFAISSIYHRPTTKLDGRRSSPNLSEILALLHLHFLEGRLRPGVHLSIPRFLTPVQQSRLMIFMQARAMGLEAVTSESVGTNRFQRVVSLASALAR